MAVLRAVFSAAGAKWTKLANLLQKKTRVSLVLRSYQQRLIHPMAVLGAVFSAVGAKWTKLGKQFTQITHFFCLTELPAAAHTSYGRAESSILGGWSKVD